MNTSNDLVKALIKAVDFGLLTKEEAITVLKNALGVDGLLPNG